MIYGCEHLSMAFGEQQVLHEVSLTLHPGERVCIMAPSGGGKTTLLRLFAGLETPTAGRLLGFPGARVSMVFQEDRLLEHLSPVTNVALVQDRTDREILERELEEILPAACFHQPVRELSGGMKRRTAIARALLCPSEVVLLDEPFTGLDRENWENTIRFVRRHLGGRLLILATHRQEEAELLGASCVWLG